MRRICALLSCATAAACSEKAVLVHVDTDAATTGGIELFLVAEPCPDCGQGIGTPKSNGMAVPGTAYYTDGDARVYYPLKAGEHSADFWLEPASTDHLTRIVAVGFDGQGQATSLAIGPSDVTLSQHLGEKWKLVLAPQTIMQAPPAPLDIGTGDAIYLWRPPVDPANPTPADDRASCLMITHASTQKSEFIVPPVDADCDGFTGDKECKRTIYHYAAPPADASQVCVGTPPQVPGSCRAGLLSSCVDGLGGPGCQTSSYCLPDAICSLSECDQQPFDQNCIDQLVTNITPSTIPRLQCNVPIAAGAICDLSSTVDASALFPQCQGVGFLPLAQTALPPMLRQMITITSNGTVSVTLGAVHAPCLFDMTFAGTTQAGITHPASIVVNGASGDHAVMPVVIDFAEVGVCDGGIVTTCNFAPVPSSDHVWACGK